MLKQQLIDVIITIINASLTSRANEGVNVTLLKRPIKKKTTRNYGDFVVLSLFLIVMVRKSLILKNLFNFQADYKTYTFLFLSVHILGNMRRE